jgi:hypothetical protein
MEFDVSERAEVEQMFHDLGDAEGGTGAAKALHVRAPSFFPLWDSATKAYGLWTTRAGTPRTGA